MILILYIAFIGRHWYLKKDKISENTHTHRRSKRYSGGYSIGVPPLPIPNREVKPYNADGTAEMWESR